MELFGLSAAKIILLLTIAIVLFGPDKVPEMARTVGRTIRDVRRYMNDMTKEFNEATGGLREEFSAIAAEVRGELEATQADLHRQLDLTDVFRGGTSAPDHLDQPASRSGQTDAVTAAGSVADAGVKVESVALVGLEDSAIPVLNSPPKEPLARRGGVGTAAPSPRATKADPLGDLAPLYDAPEHPTATNGRNGSVSMHAEIAAQTDGSIDDDWSQNDPRRSVGRSVSASLYVRRPAPRPHR